MSKWTRKQQALSSGHFEMPTRSRAYTAPRKQAHVKELHTRKPPPKPRIFIVYHLPLPMKRI